ncbi:hypothetical protein SAMN05443247_07186 [Bradyrhizobium erythrophlei]|nr:hypothetical protein SAMN05443247_07186 [Bradyrhizobium erythrophlei]
MVHEAFKTSRMDRPGDTAIDSFRASESGGWPDSPRTWPLFLIGKKKGRRTGLASLQIEQWRASAWKVKQPPSCASVGAIRANRAAEQIRACVYRKPLPSVMPRWNRLSWRDDWPVLLRSGRPGLVHGAPAVCSAPLPRGRYTAARARASRLSGKRGPRDGDWRSIRKTPPERAVPGEVFLLLRPTENRCAGEYVPCTLQETDA